MIRRQTDSHTLLNITQLLLLPPKLNDHNLGVYEKKQEKD